MADLSQLSDADLQSLFLSMSQQAPSASVGMPQDAGKMGPGTKYSPAQMAQLNGARDALRSAESAGVYGPGGTGTPQTQTAPALASPVAQSAPSVADVQRAMLNRQIGSAIPFVGPDVAMGARQAYDAVRQMIGHATGGGAASDQAAQSALDSYQYAYQPNTFPGSGILRGVGQMLATAPVAAVGGPAVGALKATAQGAATGALANVLTPVYGDASPDFAQQKMAQAGSGAAIGAATGGLGNVIGRVLSPNSRDLVQPLTDAGISPTLGQTLGGFWKTLEDKATSIPILGDAIKMGQSRALDQFNNAIYNKILAPIGQTYDGPVGQRALGAIRDKLSAAYESTLSKMVPSPLTNDFNSGIDNIRSMLASRPDALSAFDNAMNSEVWSRFTPANTLTPSRRR